MTAPTHTWKSFKTFVDELVTQKRTLVFRGQSRSSWGLVSTYHRLAAPLPSAAYWTQVLPLVHDYISTWTGKTWDLSNNMQRAAFVGFLQHNGFPTPLLDWTRSPYTAAYFAFEGVQNFAPNSEHVAIFAFDSARWNYEWAAIYDTGADEAHVSLLSAESRGNHKQLIQQGLYTFSTVIDQELHIRRLEAARKRTDPKSVAYLTKITLAVEETPLAIRDLALMGISAMTLDPSLPGVCKHLREILFPVSTMDENKKQEELLANLRRLKEVQTSGDSPADHQPSMRSQVAGTELGKTLRKKSVKSGTKKVAREA